MNFDRSPFFMPLAPKNVRRVKSVSFETFMFQRTASSSIRLLNTQADKHLCAYYTLKFSGFPCARRVLKSSARTDQLGAMGAATSLSPSDKRCQTNRLQF